MNRFLDALWNEHRSIAAVLHAMLFLVREQRMRGKPVDPKVFRAILYYLDVFPERMHHPKEERYLFAAIRRKTSEANAVLDELAHEHESGGHSIRDLEQTLLRYEEGGEQEFEPFAQAVEAFVAGYREHMRKEEEGVMPVARRVLTAQDWAGINAEWAANRDPLAGLEAERDYDRLISRIVELAPPPIGIGERS
jgi:hemerythrin-like domain-containing protein